MAEEQKSATTFDIRKIYLKDVSFESPNVPNVFLSENGKPEISIEVTIKTTALEQENYFEVALGVTVTSKIEEKTAFLVEVLQAGVFHIVGIPDKDMPLALEVACPNVLLPFARESISDLVGKAGFPQLLIAPINFESLYHSKLRETKKAQDEKEQTSTH
ncbi:MAG: protein-export chaperone SecB [Acidiferrobacterales bacterium]|nr:protein-export chaperone SecB [Acidiferrobacterales bacterium]